MTGYSVLIFSASFEETSITQHWNTVGEYVLNESESEVAQSCRLLATPWTAASQAAPSMGFSRQEYWSGLPFSSPGDLPNPRAATGESVAFCDADDEVGSGWLQAMGKALSSHDFVACRMGTVKLNPVWVRKSRGNPQRDGLQMIWYPPYLPHAGGGTIGVKKELVELIGGFDESLPILHDTDFCFRLQLAGTKLHFVPDAVTHIRYRGTAWSNYRQSRNFAEYNVLLSKRYRSSDVKMSSQLWRRYLYDWKRLLLNSPTIRGKAGRFAWMWLFGRQVGRLQGSIKHQTPPV